MKSVSGSYAADVVYYK